MSVSANFIADIATLTPKFISIVEIILSDRTVYYSTRDLTDTTPDCLSYLMDHPKISGGSLDIREVSTSISTASFGLLDKDQAVTADMVDESYINKDLKIYLYFDNGSNTFPTDALLVFSGKIDGFSSDNTSIKFTAREIRFEAEKALFDAVGNINGDLNNSATTIPIKSTTGFQTAGKIKIDDEVITYTGKTTTTFTGATRGALGSTAAEHDDDAEVLEIWESGSINPITLMLRILLSINGDGANHATYDVLTEGVGLDPDDIDIDSFTDIRDANSFGSYSFTIAGGISSALNFIESDILAPTLTRLITSKDGLLTLVRLDQSEFTAATDTIDNDSIIDRAQLKVSSRSIINDIQVKYKYDVVLDGFEEYSTETDTESISMYGSLPSSKKRFEFKGMQDSTQAATFMDDYLARNATPVPIISFKTFLRKRLLNPGDDILLTIKNLPNLEDGSRNFNHLTEILSVSQDGPIVSFEAAFTRFSTGRALFISPARAITSKASETEFTLTSGGSLFRTGMNVRLYDSTIGSNMLLYCDFTSSVNANFSAGSKTALINGSASVSGGFLVLTGSGNNSIGFPGYLNCSLKQSGAIRIRVKPNYSGSPATEQHFVAIGNPGDFNNLINIYHTTAGNLVAVIYGAAGNQIVSISGAWSPSSGTSYEIELNFDLGNGWFEDTGATRLFVGGTQHGSTSTAIGSKRDATNRTRLVQYVILGSDRTNIKTSDFSVSEFAIFKSVQHTSGYSPSLFSFAESSDYRTITGISSNTITIDSAFDITIDTSKHYMAFADYPDLALSPTNQRFWGNIAPTEDGFEDGTTAYVIKS